MHWNPEGPSLDARRRDFLTTVESYADAAALGHAEALLDALVGWSQEHPHPVARRYA